MSRCLKHMMQSVQGYNILIQIVGMRNNNWFFCNGIVWDDLMPIADEITGFSCFCSSGGLGSHCVWSENRPPYQQQRSTQDHVPIQSPSTPYWPSMESMGFYECRDQSTTWAPLSSIASLPTGLNGKVSYVPSSPIFLITARMQLGSSLKRKIIGKVGNGKVYWTLPTMVKGIRFSSQCTTLTTD